MSDRELRDIGLSRAEIEFAVTGECRVRPVVVLPASWLQDRVNPSYSQCIPSWLRAPEYDHTYVDLAEDLRGQGTG